MPLCSEVHGRTNKVDSKCCVNVLPCRSASEFVPTFARCLDSSNQDVVQTALKNLAEFTLLAQGMKVTVFLFLFPFPRVYSSSFVVAFHNGYAYLLMWNVNFIKKQGFHFPFHFQGQLYNSPCVRTVYHLWSLRYHGNNTWKQENI